MFLRVDSTRFNKNTLTRCEQCYEHNLELLVLWHFHCLLMPELNKDWTAKLGRCR